MDEAREQIADGSAMQRFVEERVPATSLNACSNSGSDHAATRETKEQPTLDRLNETRDLIESGSDLRAVDQQGRTVLHWTVFGSSYTMKAKIRVAYEEIANTGYCAAGGLFRRPNFHPKSE